jgi:hypothetical protein
MYHTWPEEKLQNSGTSLNYYVLRVACYNFQDFNPCGMEGGIHKAESNEFRDLLYLTSKQPFILRLAFSAGIGGLLFGYDTGPSKLSTCLCSRRSEIDAKRIVMLGIGQRS